jgi:hypothetical protein
MGRLKIALVILRAIFAPLEPRLINSAPEHANSGRVQHGSLAPIWEWISRDLLPTMARDYVNGMNRLIASNNLRGAQQVATTFQIKVLKILENTLSSPGGADQSVSNLRPIRIRARSMTT